VFAFKKACRYVMISLKTETGFQLHTHNVILVLSPLLCHFPPPSLLFKCINIYFYFLYFAWEYKNISGKIGCLKTPGNYPVVSFLPSICVVQILGYFTCQFSLVLPLLYPFP